MVPTAFADTPLSQPLLIRKYEGISPLPTLSICDSKRVTKSLLQGRKTFLTRERASVLCESYFAFANPVKFQIAQLGLQKSFARQALSLHFATASPR